MDIKNVLETRYSTKAFDGTKKISAEDMETIKSILQLSPSSTNVQPWHFVIASSDEGKERVAKAAQGAYAYNIPKILNASATIIFASKISVTDDHLMHVLDKEFEDGRFASEQLKNDGFGLRKFFADLHRYEMKDVQQWAEKQVYLNLGNFLLGVGALGVDAITMEGVDLKVLDEEFGLREKGFTSLFVVSVGYRAEDDFNAKLPKSRLAIEEIIEEV